MRTPPGRSGLDERVDLIIGKHPWQRRAVERARPVSIKGAKVPVVTAADLVLLKLYAGGPQDAWDIHQLVAGTKHDALRRALEKDLKDLPRNAQRLWHRIEAELGSEP